MKYKKFYAIIKLGSDIGALGMQSEKAPAAGLQSAEHGRMKLAVWTYEWVMTDCFAPNVCFFPSPEEGTQRLINRIMIS